MRILSVRMSQLLTSHYHITKKQHNEEATNIYKIDKSKAFNNNNHRSLTEQYFHKEAKI